REAGGRHREQQNSQEQREDRGSRSSLHVQVRRTPRALSYNGRPPSALTLQVRRATRICTKIPAAKACKPKSSDHKEKRNMRSIRKAFCISTLTLALSQAASAAQFSNVVIFGDSLSDGGQYGARFTTNPGTTAFENVARYFGYTVKPSTQGGTDYAFGGARV